MVFVTVIVGVVVLIVGLVAVYRSIQIVEEGELYALFVLGEMNAVLHPGLNIVPPFVSKTYSIDPQTMAMDRGGEQVTVPAEFEKAVREASESLGDTKRHTGTDIDSTGTVSTRERAATVFGWTLFVLGAFGLAVPMFMLSHILNLERGRVSWLFPEATIWQAILATVIALYVMIIGENVGRRYGTWGNEQENG